MGSCQDYFHLPRRLCYTALVLLVVCVAVAVVERNWWLTRLGGWLVVSAPVEPVDVIVSLGGGAGHRERYAAALYRRGLAPRILVTGSSVQLPGLDNVAYADLATQELVADGVPKTAIRAVPSTSTRDDAEQTKAVFDRERWRSAIIVSDPYHMRRAMLTFEQVFRGSGVRLLSSPAEPNWFVVDGWWRRERSFQAVVGEYEKLAYYLVNGYL